MFVNLTSGIQLTTYGYLATLEMKTIYGRAQRKMKTYVEKTFALFFLASFTSASQLTICWYLTTYYMMVLDRLLHVLYVNI